MSRRIQDELTRRSMSGQRQQQLRKNPGLGPAAPGAAAAGGRPCPIRLDYRAEGIEVAASIAGHTGLTRPALGALVQSFLTSLTWICSTNCSPTNGWLSLTVRQNSSLWKVGRRGGDDSCLRLVPVSGKLPGVFRGAVAAFGSAVEPPEQPTPPLPRR